MKAVILAAGKGSRIKAVTKITPKSLLPLSDTTLLGHSLRNFRAQGVDDIIVVVGYERQQIIDYVNMHWEGGVEFVYNPHFEITNVLYSFWLSMPFLDDEDFLFLHADTVFSSEVMARMMTYPDSAQMVFAVDNHPCQEEEMKVQTAGGVVTVVNKEMDPSICAGEFLGLARIKAANLPALRLHAEQLFEEGKMQSFFESAIQRMIDKDELMVAVCDVTGLPWREVDFPEDYDAARVFFS